MDKLIATRHFFENIDAFHLIDLRASEVKEAIRSGTIGKSFSFQGINTFQLNHFGASKVKELIRTDTLAKCLT